MCIRDRDTDVAKWLEAVAYTLEAFPDEELERLADETIALIGRAQQEDGYLDTYFIIKEPEGRFKNLQEGHEPVSYTHLDVYKRQPIRRTTDSQ